MPRLRRTLRQVPTEQRGAPGDPRVQTLEQDGLRWIQIEAPTAAELAWLEHEFDFHELDLEDIRSRRQRPKVDVYPDYLFVVLHFPRFDKERGRLFAVELNVFIGRDFLITIPNGPLKPAENVFRRLELDADERAAWFSKGAAYLLYEILDAHYRYCFPILDQIGRKLDDAEDRLFERESDGDLVRDISNIKQEIIAYRKITKPQRPVLRHLERASERLLAGEGLDIYYDDLVDASERIWDLLENYKEIAEALEATNETAISHRQNRVLRVLTVFSVVFLTVTLLINLFSMNVPVPFQDSGSLAAFGVLTVVIGAAIAGLLLLFRRLDWL